MSEVEGTGILTRNANATSKVIVNVGGARSSKSYSIAQLFLSKFTAEKNKKFLISRKTMPALRITALKVMVDMMKDYGRYGRYNHNKTENTILNPANGNWMLFSSFDDPIKIKSTEFNYIHMEEANEYTWEEFIVLLTRTSGGVLPGERNQMFLSLNPTDIYGWINKRLRKRRDVEFIHSTYKDNPFLSRDYVETLEGLADEDEAFYKIYALGEYAELEHIIYRPYILIDEMPDNATEVLYGLDFGYNSPTGLLQIQIRDEVPYIDELLYKTKLTTSALVELLPGLIRDESDPIWCDSEDPGAIAEIKKAGFNAKPAFKGKGSVKSGIDYCKSLKIHVTKRSDNLISERASYSWKENKDGEVLDEPVKFRDHLLDAKRYALYSRAKKRRVGLQTW